MQRKSFSLSSKKAAVLSVITAALLIAAACVLNRFLSGKEYYYLMAVLIIAVPSVYIIQTWNLINKTFTPKSGATVYPILATAPIIGNMTGGGAAHFIPKHFRTETLIWSWGVCILLAIAVTFVLNRAVERLNENSPKKPNKTELIENFKDGFRHYKKSAFARDLSMVFMSFWEMTAASFSA